MKVLNPFGFFLFYILIASCSPPKLIFGTYRSNFAISGHFVEQITHKKDSSFEYQSKSHPLGKSAKGHYTIDFDKIILNYVFPTIDTTDNIYLSNLLGFSIEEDMKSWRASFPKLFFIRNGKLLSSDDNAKIVRKARTKPFLKKPKKKYYLKQIP